MSRSPSQSKQLQIRMEPTDEKGKFKWNDSLYPAFSLDASKPQGACLVWTCINTPSANDPEKNGEFCEVELFQEKFVRNLQRNDSVTTRKRANGIFLIKKIVNILQSLSQWC